MIYHGHENDGREFMLAVLSALLQGKTDEQFVEDWLSRNERELSQADELLTAAFEKWDAS